MTTTCPICRLPVALDAAGNSLCGHLRAVDGGPVPPPIQPLPPPALPVPQAAAPITRPAPPPAVQTTPPAVQPGPPPGWQPAQDPRQAGWGRSAPARRTGNGCAKAVGCLLLLMALAVAGAIALAVAWDTDRAGDGSAPPAKGAPLEGTITVGGPVRAATRTARAGSDTTLTVGKGRLAGLTLTVPAGAYETPVEVTVSASDLHVSGYGGAVNPISPLVTVDDGGGYAAAPMTVRIPVSIPGGSYAMAFYLRDDRSLEGIPVLDETPTSITIATRHFSSFFVSLIPEVGLPDDIGTGFRAGEDDFLTPNHGTVIAPAGHCAGQSLAAMWYFVERKARGAPQLFGRFDNDGVTRTPDRWEDDRTVYRLASSIQKDLDTSGIEVAIEHAFQQAKAQRIEWLAFRYAMYVTGEPQFVDLRETGSRGGHAIVAYAATPHGLWVADPNHPAELRQVAWQAASGTFATYESEQTAGDSLHHFDQVGYWGQTAMVDWGAIGARWAEADAGTIGDDRFPAGAFELGLEQADGTIAWAPWSAGMTLPTQDVRVRYTSTAKTNARATVYQLGAREKTITEGDVRLLVLPAGTSTIGFFIENLASDKRDRAVDWVNLTVTTEAPSASPPPEPLPTAEPSAEPPPTAEPTPGSTLDCDHPPKGRIARLNWELACGGGISTLPPNPKP